MPLWPLITPLLRFAAANVDYKFVYDQLVEPRPRRVPRTRAHVVDALNASLPLAKATWTPQSLFLFIAAFAKVDVARDGSVNVKWLDEPASVVAYILRGRPGDEVVLRDMLHAEGGAVFETLVAIAPQARPAQTDAPASEPRLYSETVGRWSARQQSLRDRRIALLFADALLEGGLSTNECRGIILGHGIPARDVDVALQAPPSRSLPGSKAGR